MSLSQRTLRVGLLPALCFSVLSCTKPTDAGTYQHYHTHTKSPSELPGQITIPGEFIYIEGVALCNDLEKFKALNSSCRQRTESTMILRRAKNDCIGCTIYAEPGKTLRTRLQHNTTFTVVSEFDVSNAYWIYRLFGSGPHHLVILRDPQNNLIEVSALLLTMMSESAAARPDVTEKTRQTTRARSMCFHDLTDPHGPTLPSGPEAARVLVDSMKLTSLSLSPYSCPPPFLPEGILVQGGDADEFHTFDYFTGQFDVYGSWWPR